MAGESCPGVPETADGAATSNSDGDEEEADNSTRASSGSIQTRQTAWRILAATCLVRKIMHPLFRDSPFRDLSRDKTRWHLNFS
jgi:hypothetical protein